MSELMENRVDWSGWAARAEPRSCEACGEAFRPNHPRRRFCGRPDCPGRQRRRNPARRARRTPRPRTAHANALYGLIADAVVDQATRTPDATVSELASACAALAGAARANRPPAVERSLTIRVLSIAAARAAKETP